MIRNRILAVLSGICIVAARLSLRLDAQYRWELRANRLTKRMS